MNAPSVVRLGTSSDEEEIFSLCHELHEENGLFPIDDGLVRSMLHKAFDRKGGVIGVIGDPGNIEALIFLLISSFWYSSAWHLEELFSYVRPQFRKSTHAKALVEWAKRASDEIGIPLVIGIISNTRTEAKVRLYRRQLKDPAGAFFVYRKNGADMPPPSTAKAS